MWSVFWTGTEKQWSSVSPKFNIVAGHGHTAHNFSGSTGLNMKKKTLHTNIF